MEKRRRGDNDVNQVDPLALMITHALACEYVAAVLYEARKIT